MDGRFIACVNHKVTSFQGQGFSWAVRDYLASQEVNFLLWKPKFCLPIHKTPYSILFYLVLLCLHIHNLFPCDVF
jgi:hypothetical protein